MRRPIVIIALLLIVPLPALLIGVALLQDTIRNSALPSEPPLVLQVEDRFETLDAAWALAPGWEYVPATGQAAGALQASGDVQPLAYGARTDTDLVVEIHILVEAGECRLNMRDSAAGRYSLALDPTGLITLYRDETELGSAFADPVVAGAPFRRLRLSAIGGILRVMADGEKAITVTDPDPLPAGGITLSTGKASPAACTIDEFRVWVPEG